jgi:hypothetical protein
MHATEARKIARDNLPRFENVYAVIKAAALQADCRCNYSLTEKEKKFIVELIAELEAKGYHVKRENGGDQREYWDYLTISW